jgi:hypothetical protein
VSRRLFYLNALLALGIIAAAMELRGRWIEARNREEMMRLGALQPLRATLKPPIPGAKPVSALDYTLVSSQMLFSRDRNPAIIVDPPPPPVEKKWPPLPKSYGLMLLGEKPRILLGMGAGTQKSYVAGEKVGEFEIVQFDNRTITFAWNDKTIEKRLEDLVDNNPMGSSSQSGVPPGGYGGPPGGVAAGGAASGNSARPAGGGLTSLGPGGSADSRIGADTGLQGTKSCAPGDNSPAGTVLNGMKKVVVPGMFGSSCYWEPVK